MSMAASLEVRCPFLDKEIMEYSARLQSDLKVRNRETKYILKKIAEKYLTCTVIFSFNKKCRLINL